MPVGDIVTLAVQGNISISRISGRLGCLFLALLLALSPVTSYAAPSKHRSREVTEHLEAAERLIGQQNYEGAKAEIAKVLKSDPKCTDALNNLGVVYLRLHQFDSAKDCFERALKIEPHMSTSLNNLAQVYYFSGNYDLAVDTYKEALPYMHGRDCLLLANLADALTAKGDFKEASDYYKEALRINSSFPQALLGLANLYVHLDSYEAADQFAVRAIKVKPSWALAYYQLGRIKSGRGQKLAALKAYLLSLNYEKNPDYARDTRKMVSDLGVDPRTVSQSDLAKFQSDLVKGTLADKSSLSEALSSSMRLDRQASLDHAQDYIAGQKWDQAQGELEGLLKQSQDPVILNDLGLVHAGQKEYDLAESYYLKAIKLSKGKCLSAYYNLGQLYRLKGGLIQARNSFREAITSAKQQRKSCPLANNALGMVLKQLGDDAGALAAYKLAISQSGSDFPVVHYNYAILLEKTDHAREAVNEYQLYLKLAPQGVNVDQAQARLRRLGVDS
jgi:tetratricopeptide (TPR) repeat protein